jgi:hypothetical protein
MARLMHEGGWFTKLGDFGKEDQVWLLLMVNDKVQEQLYG